MGSEVDPRENHHQSLSEFTATTGRNTTGVELGPNARMVLWACLGLFTVPYILLLARPAYDNDGLWFGDGIVATWAHNSTSGIVLGISAVAFIIVAATLIAAKIGPPSSPLLAASAASVVGAGAVAIPVGIVIVVLIANLIAVVVVAVALVAFAGLAISNWLDS